MTEPLAVTETHVTIAAVALAVAIPVLFVIAAWMTFKAPERLKRIRATVTLIFNLVVLGIAGILLGGTFFFLYHARSDSSGEALYLGIGCFIFLLIFLGRMTMHKASWTNLIGESDVPERVVGLFRETGQLWRERFPRRDRNDPSALDH